MRILIACEKSGKVRDAFIARGHEAVSCDIEDSERAGPHIKGNVLEHLDRGWDAMIAHPECTYISASGLHWNCRTEGRALKTREAVEFAEKLWLARIPKICVENPIGCLSTFSILMKPSQIIQPYDFEEDASKATCLWVKGFPLLKGTGYIEPRIADGKQRWGNQTDSGQNKLAPSLKRSAQRAETYQGIANAMAEQWG